MWYISVKSGKIKDIKMPDSLGSVYFFLVFQDFRGIIDDPKTIDACISRDPFAVLFKMRGN